LISTHHVHSKTILYYDRNGKQKLEAMMDDLPQTKIQKLEAMMDDIPLHLYVFINLYFIIYIIKF
jgi:hypothetical protein